MKNLTWNDIFLLKFCFYGGISAYDYSIGSKYTFGWLVLALLVLAIWIIEKIREQKH